MNDVLSAKTIEDMSSSGADGAFFKWDGELGHGSNV